MRTEKKVKPGIGCEVNFLIRRQKAEGRRQKAEGRRQKAEGRRQKAEGSGGNLPKDLWQHFFIQVNSDDPAKSRESG